jgi:hypothetical protein
MLDNTNTILSLFVQSLKLAFPHGNPQCNCNLLCFPRPQTVSDGKNGVHCNISFNNVTNTITVKSDTAGRVGYLLLVTEGTVANPPGSAPQGANKACGIGLGGKSVVFKVNVQSATQLPLLAPVVRFT